MAISQDTSRGMTGSLTGHAGLLIVFTTAAYSTIVIFQKQPFISLNAVFNLVVNCCKFKYSFFVSFLELMCVPHTKGFRLPCWKQPTDGQYTVVNKRWT